MNGPVIVILVGAASSVVGLAWLLVMHGRGRLDLLDVVMDPDAGGVRRASLRKIGEAVALGASTFVVVYDSLKVAGPSDMILGLYLAAWVSRTLLGMLAQARAGAITAAAGGGK